MAVVQLHRSGLLGGARPDSSRAARSGGVRCALRAHRRLLCDRGTREIWRAEAAERLSAAERRLKKILGPWGTGRTKNSTEDGTKVLHGENQSCRQS